MEEQGEMEDRSLYPVRCVLICAYGSEIKSWLEIMPVMQAWAVTAVLADLLDWEAAVILAKTDRLVSAEKKARMDYLANKGK